MLLVLLFVKHYIADFLLQTDWMVRGKSLPKGSKWVEPLLAHSWVHALLTYAILLCYTDWATASLIYFAEIPVHFAIDRVKASPSLLGRYKDISAKPFWYALGADQLAHALTYLAIAYLVT